MRDIPPIPTIHAHLDIGSQFRSSFSLLSDTLVSSSDTVYIESQPAHSANNVMLWTPSLWRRLRRLEDQLFSGQGINFRLELCPEAERMSIEQAYSWAYWYGVWTSAHWYVSVLVSIDAGVTRV